MALIAYITGMVIAALFCWAAFAMVVFSVNPFKADIVSISTFFISLFFAVASTLTIILLYFRSRIKSEETPTALLGISFRYAALVSLAFVGLLVLQALRILTWWDGALVVIAILLIEMFFRARKVY